MTRSRDNSMPFAAHEVPESSGPAHSARNTARSNPTIIDGVAEVTERRRLDKSAAARAAALGEYQTDEPFWAAGEADARSRGFGRRTESFFANAGPFGRTARDRTALVARRHENDSDLLWQALDLSRHALKPNAEPIGLEAALPQIQRNIGLKARNAALIAGGFLFGLLAIPVVLLSSSAAPVTAPISNVAVMGNDAGDLVLERVVASLVPRGQGKVLSVEGTVRNVAEQDALVPLLHIALAREGSVIGERPLSIGVKRLSSGQSAHFVSRIAVASATSGEIAIGFQTHGPASASNR